MLVDNHFADSQPQTASRPVSSTSIRGVLFKDQGQMLFWNAWAGISNIDAISIGLVRRGMAPLRIGGGESIALQALREIGIPADLDNAILGREFTCVVENVDQHLLNLTGFET